jgi:hypothetical protein
MLGSEVSLWPHSGQRLHFVATSTGPLSSELGAMRHRDAWWVVVLRMLVPPFDYLTEVRSILMGVITRHLYRHWAWFFAGLAVGMGLLLLLAPSRSLGLGGFSVINYELLLDVLSGATM